MEGCLRGKVSGGQGGWNAVRKLTEEVIVSVLVKFVAVGERGKGRFYSILENQAYQACRMCRYEE